MNFLPRLLRLFIATVITLFFTVSVVAAPLLRPLTPDQGLSQGSITDLLIDNDGFLWLATEGGLNRYDSNQVVQLSADGFGLREVMFSRLLQDSEHRIYAATLTGEIYRYDATSGYMVLFSQLRQYFETEQYPLVSGLVQLNEKFLLLNTDKALVQVSRRTGEAQKLFDLLEQGQADGWLRNLIVYKEYALLAAYNGVIAYNTITGEHHYIAHIDPATATADQLHTKYLSVHNGKLWIGAVEGLYSIQLTALDNFLADETPYQVTTEITSLNIWKLLWQDDTALIPTELGLFRFTPATGTVTPVLRLMEAGLELSSDTIVDIVADNEDGYWLASRNDGAFYWHPRSEAFSQLGRGESGKQGLSNDKIYSLLQDNDFLWVATGNGLNRLNLNSGESDWFFVSDDPKAIQHDGDIYHIINAGENKIWLALYTGLKLFDTKALKLIPLENVASEDLPYFDRLSYGYYYYQQQLYFFRLGKLMRYTPHTGEVADVTNSMTQIGSENTTIFARLEGKHKGLLVTKPDEVWLWQPDTGNSRLLYRHDNYTPQSQRFADTALADKYNQLWLGISGIGLLVFDVNTLELKRRFLAQDSLLSDAVYAFQQDKYGDIWFSSHKGLSRIKPQSMQIEFFTRADGVPTHEYNGGSALTLADGTLMYGSMRGLTILDPGKLQQTLTENRAIITGISVLRGEQPKLNANLNDRTFTLSHQDLGITIQFSAMSFSRNHKMRYRYWLTGSQNINYPVQSSNQVVFPQLDAGNYQFHVVAVAPDSGEESPIATLRLIVKPAPWLSPWAISGYVTLILILSAWLLLFRHRQLEAVRKAHLKAQESAQRLKQALASVNSGAWEWRSSSNQIYAGRVHNMLGYSEQMNLLNLQQHISLIHPDDKAAFTKKWQRFLLNPEASFDCTYRMQDSAGKWLWFRDLGRAIDLDENNSPRTVTGTFSNITETRANQEKARLFGEAFQQTRDWVVILDHRQRVLAANQSFATAFGNMEQYLDQPRIHHLGISLVRRRFYTKLLHELKPGDHWQGEEQVITPDGRERPTLINISAIGEQQQQSFYVLVFTDITAQKLAEDELRYLANYDALTGLPNRALLMDRIYHGIDQAKREKRTLALCFIDLDKFKQINDSLGHDIGDLLLKEVARRLTLSLRESDTVARLGGDEFVVLLEGYKTEDNISHVARKMLSIVSEPMLLGAHTVGVSPSIGIAVYPDDAINATELLKHADVAMYHAKEAGRNNFQFFIAEMNEKAHMRLARESRLRKAIHDEEFQNYYQPIINSQTHQVVGAEVLLRWHTHDGAIPPSEFVPLAEELRLIIKMTQQLLERALSDLKRWHQDGHQLYLSVNLSTQHLEQPALAEHTKTLLQKYQLPASCLRFEVTESALMRDHQSAIETMNALSELGVQLALDDFGTGYSSLKYLKELPIDGIKIDRSFVQDIGIDSSDETIIEAMLSMASSLGMYCVAEGVETEQQLAFFNRRHCYLIQGYLFAKPMPAEDLLEFLQNGQHQA